MTQIKALFLIIIFANTFSFSRAARETFWAFCNDSNKLAYTTAQMAIRKPQSDWVCALQMPSQTTNPDAVNTRCLNDQTLECTLDAGGNTETPGSDNNVPRDAWFRTGSAVKGILSVRCQCGCLTGDVKILTNFGNMSIENMASDSKGNLRVATIANLENGELTPSGVLSKKDFTVGPETIPVMIIETADGTITKMTGTHPILIESNNGAEMIQAQKLTSDDRLILQSGEGIGIKKITTEVLQRKNNLVYNLNTNGKSAHDHIVVGNGLMMGDLVWQKRLSEINSRENLLYQYSKN